MKEAEKIKHILQGKQNIFITTHVRPDADAIGSSLALYHFFRQSGFRASLIFPNEAADYYDWFPGIKDVLIFDKQKDEVKNLLQQAHVVFVVDFSQLSRNGALGKLIADCGKPKVVIDHHPEPEMMFDAYFWDTGYSAAAEAVFELIEYLNPDLSHDKTISECVYAALIADSGSFSYPGVSPETHLIAAKLMKNGINHSQIDKLIFKNFTAKRLFFWGYCLSEKLGLYYDDQLAIINISLRDFEKFQTDYTDTENLVNMPMMIEKVRISVLAIERENKIRLSFRSKEEIPVNELARMYFEGGGHKNAAGGDSLLNLEDTVNLIIAKSGEYLD